MFVPPGADLGSQLVQAVRALAQSVRVLRRYPDRVSETSNRLAALRRRAGLTQEQLAARLHRSASWVQKVEQGSRSLTDLRVLEEVALALGVPVAELVGHESAETGFRAPDLPAEEMQRQAFARGLGVLTLRPESFATLDVPRRVDRALVSALIEGTEELERLYGRLTPVALQGLVSGHLDALMALLRGSPGKYRRELLSLAGETSTLAGWIAVDRGNDDRALSHFDGALRAATEAGDTALSVYAMGSATTVPTFRERSPRTVVELFANGARGVMRTAATPTTAAWVATLEASAYAKLDDRDSALHALARAEEVFGPDDPETARPRVPFFNRGRLAGEQGIIRLRLATTRPDITARYLRTALIELEPDAKIRARFLTALAVVHADEGDVMAACKYATEAYDLGVLTDTVRSIDQVRELRRGKLEQWKMHPAVRELDEHMKQAPDA